MPDFSSWSLPVQFASPLGPAAWAALAGVPASILALYFLKLRRRPVQVPSTLLWRRSLEDLHVNSLFQRLRRNLLLFLQLLAVALAMLALAGPKVKGTAGLGQRYILAIDTSASMRASDVAPDRLAMAKAEARKVVEAMNADDLAMLISFSDRAKVEASYSGNRRLLLSRIDGLKPTESTTSLRDALVVAAGLANPAKQLTEGSRGDDGLAPRFLIFTDGGFEDVEGFSLGNIKPELVIVGNPPEAAPPEAPTKKAVVDREDRKSSPSNNLAILALQSARGDDKPDEFQVFGRAHNFRAEAVETEVKLFRHDPDRPKAEPTLIDALALTIPPGADQAFKFELPDPGRELLEVRLAAEDDLPLDNRAFTTVGIPRKARILLVSRGDRYLSGTLQTPAAKQLADVVEVSPEEALKPESIREVASGLYDLVIYDRVSPEVPPAANALYFGALPPGPAYAQSKEVEGPVILDWDIAHPLMQYIRDLRLVRVLKANVVEPPPGSTRLIESNLGTLAFIAPRQGFSDAVVTFGLFGAEDGKATELNTDWFLRFYSFPLFLFNAVRVLGNARETGGEDLHRPGIPVVLRADPLVESIRVIDPAGNAKEVPRSPQGTFLYNDAGLTGLYQARWGEDNGTDFAVNLFDPRESDLATRGTDQAIQIGNTAVTEVRRTAPARLDWWKPIALLALGVLLLEWFIYNRRVFI